MTTSTTPTTRFTTSADGTRIAYDVRGDGMPLVLVDGAFQNRSFGDALPALLGERLTVAHYDRRGRNESGDTRPYAVEREIEDLAAVIDEIGGAAAVYGMSSGAALALEAALAGLPITRLALYEPPFVVDDSRSPVADDYVAQLEARSPGDAAEYFMTAAVQMPAEVVAGMRQSPMWPALEAVAHTLAYDGRVMGRTMSGDPSALDRFAPVAVPTLVMTGGESWPFMHTGGDALARVLPNAQRRTIDGYGHDVAPEAIAPVLVELLA